MKKIIKNLLKYYFKNSGIFKVPFGKNKGLLMRYTDDLNLDMMLGYHEPNTFQVFDSLITEGMTVVDIGANIGYFTGYLSKKVGNSGIVYAFEPIPSTAQKLQETIKINQLSNVEMHEFAVSDKNGTAQIFISHTHYMASLDEKWAGTQNGTIIVKTITLDSFFEKLNIQPDFIKMDIEGGGVYALKGMINCISKFEPILLLESHTPEEDIAIGDALRLAQYEVFRVGNNKPVKNLNGDYTDPYGIYETVVGIPLSRFKKYKNLNINNFQKKRIGQR